MVFQTYAEVCFLYAEAFERGWAGSAPGDAATWYGLGVEAAMQMYEPLYGSNVSVSQSEIDAYIAANPYAGGEDGLKQIGEQVWIATILNFYETFANWRRTGYPELTPVSYPGDSNIRKVRPASMQLIMKRQHPEWVEIYSHPEFGGT